MIYSTNSTRVDLQCSVPPLASVHHVLVDYRSMTSGTYLVKVRPYIRTIGTLFVFSDNIRTVAYVILPSVGLILWWK